MRRPQLPQPPRRRETDEDRDDRLAHEREHRAWLETGHDAEAAERMPLADMECRHGALPHDREVRCSCWGKAFDPAVLLPLAGTLEKVYTCGIPQQEAVA